MTTFHSWDTVKHEIFDVEDLDAIELGARGWSLNRERTGSSRSAKTTDQLSVADHPHWQRLQTVDEVRHQAPR